jgi:hypothetical protein
MADFASIRFLPSRPLLRELSADRLNTILTEIKRNRPKGERGITVRQDGTGTHIGLAASLPQGGGTPTTPQPWDLIAQVDPDADPEDETPDYLVTVRPGTVNNILPTNWDIEERLLSDGTLYYAKAVISTDGQNIIGLSIQIDDQAPTIQPPEEYAISSEIEYLFGLFCITQAYRVINNGNISLLPKQWIVVSADPSSDPGQSPYDIYYKLA